MTRAAEVTTASRHSSPWLAAVLACSGAVQAADCPKLPDPINRAIAAAAEQQRAAEYCEFRLSAKGDVTGDGKPDLIVAYSLEGGCGSDKRSAPGSCGNHNEQYLRLFTGPDFAPGPAAEVGGRGSRYLNKLRVNHGQVLAGMAVYRKTDPQCCPSGKGKAAFRAVRGTLEEQQHRITKRQR